jgi:hypothetical protein
MTSQIGRRRAGILACLGASALLTARATPAAAAEGSIAHDDLRDRLEFDPRKFSRSTTVDNKWLPLVPGTQSVYEGHTVEDRKRIPHKVVITVTDLVKVIAGVPVVVTHELDISDGVVEEQELMFLAQDDDGNVWHFGQLRETYDEQEFVGGRAFMPGLPEGAKAGIMMPADPREGTPSFSQGFAPPPYNWSDRGRVRKAGEATTVPAGSFDDVLLVEEWSDSEEWASQLKYHAAGVGVVRVGWLGNDPVKEELELVKVDRLGPRGMAEARETARGIEERAYVYSHTHPAGPRTR